MRIFAQGQQGLRRYHDLPAHNCRMWRAGMPGTRGGTEVPQRTSWHGGAAAHELARRCSSARAGTAAQRHSTKQHHATACRLAECISNTVACAAAGKAATARACRLARRMSEERGHCGHRPNSITQHHLGWQSLAEKHGWRSWQHQATATSSAMGVEYYHGSTTAQCNQKVRRD